MEQIFYDGNRRDDAICNNKATHNIMISSCSNDKNEEDVYNCLSSVPPPPPPRSDISDESVSSIDEHLQNNNNMDSLHYVGGHEVIENNNTKLNYNITNNDESLLFGDETMHLLMDADLRLNTFVPPSTFAAILTSPGGIQGGGVGIINDNIEEEEDGLSEGLSTGATSLLRGPIMAAKSTNVMNNINSNKSGVVLLEDETPSKVRAEFLLQTTNNDGIMTPSTARSEFIHSTQKKTQQFPLLSASSSSSQRNNTPSEFIGSTHQQPNRRRYQGKTTPSDTTVTPSSKARNQFLTSPQESVSTMGQSPSDAYNVGQNTTPSTQRNLIMSPQNAGENFAVMSGNNSRQKEKNDSSPLSMTKYINETTPMSNGSYNSNRGGRRRSESSGSPILAMSEQFIDSMNQHNTLSGGKKSSPSVAGSGMNGKSVENMIALGEQQMTKNAAAETTITHVPPPKSNKKPFLRKGTRREPSSLTTMNNNNTITPSTARRRQQEQFNNNDVDASPSTQHKPESLSERKERLARLEKMQEDLMKDLERRKVRKEEARKDRQRMAKKGVVATGTTPSKKSPVTRSIVKNGANKHQQSKLTTTPSRARPRSVTKTRFAEDEEHQTPSQARKNSTNSPQTSLQCAPPPRSAVKKPKSPAARNETDDDDNNTPLQQQARAPTSSLATKHDDSSIANIVDKYLEHEDICIEGKEVKFQEEDEGIAIDDAENINLNQEVATPGVTNVNVGINKSNSSSKHQARSKSTPKSRPRTSASSSNRSGGPRANSAAKRRNNSREEADDKKAFEDWKKKEEEQWALVKNMRRRQEAALREAEGERERAKAWAVAEKEAVEKWALDQRALIKKDRHKASNAALVATQKLNKLKRHEEEEENNAEDVEEIKSELERLQMEMKKRKAKESVEMNRLKEVIRRQERSINALKNGGTKSEEVKAPASKNGKSPTVGSSRQVLGDRSLKENSQPQQQQSKRKPLTELPTQKQSEVVITEDVIVPAVEVDDEEEEPTEYWLQRHLSKLNNANNQLGVKVMGNEGLSTNSTDNGQVVGNDSQQRKPYNAANYGAPTERSTQALPAKPNKDSVPQVITALSPSMQHVDGGGTIGEDNNHSQPVVQSKSQIFTYKNGTQKEVLPDGTTTISFANGDRKRTYANEKKGIVVYYYAATKTTQVTHQDGMQTYHFPNKQIENHYTDGRKEITFPDGTTRMVHLDGTTDTTFVDGVRVIDYPDGRQQVIQA